MTWTRAFTWKVTFSIWDTQKLSLSSTVGKQNVKCPKYISNMLNTLHCNEDCRKYAKSLNQLEIGGYEEYGKCINVLHVLVSYCTYWQCRNSRHKLGIKAALKVQYGQENGGISLFFAGLHKQHSHKVPKSHPFRWTPWDLIS